MNFANYIGIEYANYVGVEDDGEGVKVAAGLFFFALSGGIVYLLMRSLLAWRSGSPVYLMLAAAAVSLTFATKETAFVSFGTMLIAIVCVAVWQMIWRNNGAEKLAWKEETELTFKKFAAAFGKLDDAIWMIILSIVVFAVVGALFFSSFFAYRGGISGAFEAYAFWSKTSSQDHASNGYRAYLWWMLNLESPLVALSALGTLIAFWKAKHRFAMFAGLWAFGLFAAYTLIKYKTPWLALSFTMPMALIGGYAINELAVSRQIWQRGAAAFLAATAFGVCAYQTIELNFYSYDDDSKPYVYAHTKRGFLDMVREIDRFAELSGKGKESQIIVVSPDYWSLPWYLRNYPNAAFFGKFPDEDSSAAEIVIGEAAQAEKLALDYSPYYDYKGTFPLRPGVELMLYVRKGIEE
ncbi:MAG: hypothetical protein H7Z37_02120 [Pyrinomonadaceae bacterium]|nr:hypothetical protein [Pyrinomonadaceae bacterium]